MRIELNEQQAAAVEKAVERKFWLISGGAGTGKTTIIKEIVDKIGGGCVLCAPTGKAAARLREATSREASTIHRMLGWNGERFSKDTLKGCVVIVDEASMVDSDLMSAIMRRDPTKLILVGDHAQLPPVGAGSPFHDILALRSDLATELTQSYRATGAIYQAGLAVRNGELPQAGDDGGERVIILDTGKAPSTEDWIETLADQLDYAQDAIITPRNGDKSEPMPCTVHALNQAIVSRLNPRQDDEKWKVGDRIICLKNFASVDVWNGTTGTVTAVDSEKEAWVRTDYPCKNELTGEYETEVLFNRAMLMNSQLAYAISVHKSQGSQYHKVVIPCLVRDSFALLTRELLYTAITRARKECVIVGERNAILTAIRKIATKNTVIKELAKHGSNAA